MMKFTVSILGVDGSSSSIVTSDAHEALIFLRRNDHEGSSVLLITEMTEEDERAYQALGEVIERTTQKR